MKPICVMRTLKINKATIKNYMVVDPRKLRKKQVYSILRALENKTHFEAPFVVNLLDTKIRVIDGNHRLAAIEKFFATNSRKSIQIHAATYKNLSKEEEKEVYSIWNKPIRQSTHDFINSYKNTIPMYKRLTSELPCTVYGSKKKLRIKNVCEAFFVSQRESFGGGVNYTNYDFVQNMKNMKDADVDDIVDTFNLMYKSFNPTNYPNFVAMPAFKTSPYIALFTLIHQNKEEISQPQIKKFMEKALVNNPIVAEYNRGGRKACIQAYGVFKGLLNAYSNNQFN